MNIEIAPIVLFVYARPEHTRKTLAALIKNSLAKDSPLIIFSDGPRGVDDAELVLAVRRLVRSITGFASVEIYERSVNVGLAQNILGGLSQVFKRYPAAIILEDDIVCAPGFLTYMNSALSYFEKNNSIWHLNGWNYPIASACLPNIYCSRVMNCWGWATWANRWSLLNAGIEYSMKSWSLSQKFRFNQDGTYPFYSHFISNYLGRRKTWAIYWYASIFDAGGLCLTPSQTLTNEIGSDGSGEHGLQDCMYWAELSQQSDWNFSDLSIVENQEARKAVSKFNRQNFSWSFRFMNSLKIFIPWWVWRLKKWLDR